ncbi:MAG: YgaP family membrane protein [Thermodesulfobacteriota bacterium]
MNIDKLVFRFAGILILLSLLLAWVHSPYWLALTAFIGINMAQASFSGFCPMAKLLKAVGIKPGKAFE